MASRLVLLTPLVLLVGLAASLPAGTSPEPATGPSSEPEPSDKPASVKPKGKPEKPTGKSTGEQAGGRVGMKGFIELIDKLFARIAKLENLKAESRTDERNAARLLIRNFLSALRNDGNIIDQIVDIGEALIRFLVREYRDMETRINANEEVKTTLGQFIEDLGLTAK